MDSGHQMAVCTLGSWAAKQEQIHRWYWGPHIRIILMVRFFSLVPCVEWLEYRNCPSGVHFCCWFHPEVWFTCSDIQCKTTKKAQSMGIMRRFASEILIWNTNLPSPPFAPLSLNKGSTRALFAIGMHLARQDRGQIFPFIKTQVRLWATSLKLGKAKAAAEILKM